MKALLYLFSTLFGASLSPSWAFAENELVRVHFSSQLQSFVELQTTSEEQALKLKNIHGDECIITAKVSEQKNIPFALLEDLLTKKGFEVVCLKTQDSALAKDFQIRVFLR